MVKIEDLEIEDLFEGLDQVEIGEIDILDVLKPIGKNIYKLNSKIDRRLRLGLQEIKNNIQMPKDGKDYILTSKDKKEIADSIKIPVVEKIVEKTETIIEKPIVTNEIKEVAMYELGEQIVEKINSLPIDDDEYKIDASHITNLPIFTGGRKYSLNGVPTGGTTGQKLVKKTSQDYDMQWVDDSNGISSIVAGTGIDVDNTDPANPIVSIESQFYEADNSEITTTYTYWGFTNGDSVYQINRRDNTTFVKTMAIGAWADRLTLSYT